LSNNIDNLLGDIYSSSSQSQGVKELANLINNLSQLLLKAISQLEGRVAKLEQQTGRAPRAVQPMAPSPSAKPSTPPPPMPKAPKPKAASPFSAPAAPKSTPPPPPQPTSSAGGDPGSVAEAASMLGVTLKKAPEAAATSAPADSASGPSFLTSTVDPNAQTTAPSSTAGIQPDAVAPASAGVAGPAGGFRGELAEKLAKRRQKVQKQIDDDFDAPDLSTIEEDEMIEEPAESTSSELKTDLEDELRNAFSKLKE
jgi:hypothetical protein